MKHVRPVSHTVPNATTVPIKSVLTNAAPQQVTKVSIIEHSTPKFYTPIVTKPLANTVTANFGTNSFLSHASIKVLEQNTTKISACFLPVSPNLLSKIPFIYPKVETLADKYFIQYSSNATSVVDLPDSPFRPKWVSKELFFQGSLPGIFMRSLKAGMSPEEAFICAIYAYGSPGANFKNIQPVIKEILGTNVNDMLNYIPEFYLNNFSSSTLGELKQMDLRNGSLFMEMFSMGKVNLDLQHPLTRYESPNIVRDGPGIQNLTHNASPDFVRQFSAPIAGIISQYYDQKSGTGWMSKQNHLRPVTCDLGEKVNQAQEILAKSINTWMHKTNNIDHKIANTLLEYLAALKKAYNVTNNGDIYASSYNKVRDTYNVFITENNIPMNLVIEVGLGQMLVNKNSVKCFQKTYLEMCYSPSSSWVHYLSAHLQKTNGVLNNYPEVIKEFAIKEFDNFTRL